MRKKVKGLSSPPRAAALLCALWAVGLAAIGDARADVRVEPELLAAADRGALERFMVVLTEQADVSAAASLPTRREMTRFVFERLRETAERTQPAVRAELERQGYSVHGYVITNQLLAQAAAGRSVSAATLRTLAARADVARLLPVGEARLLDEAPAKPWTPAGRAIRWTANVAAIGARDLYLAGIRGRGIVVGILDSGAVASHPALRMQYRGRGVGDDYSWFDPTVEHRPRPVDTNGHGTHVTGIAVGKTPGLQIGVAPEASWIHCRGLGPDASADTVMRCLDWFLAPTDRQGRNPNPDLAPDVTNHSYICPFCGLEQAFANLSAAGIFSVGAVANFGPTCGSAFSPGDFPSVTSIGATTGGPDSPLADFSSRGPVPGGLIKPNLVAPGEQIVSAAPPDGYAVQSGTSQASPHVAGAVALLWSHRPELRGRISATRAVLYRTAHPRLDEAGECSSADARPNDLFGYGFLDIVKATCGSGGCRR